MDPKTNQDPVRNPETEDRDPQHEGRDRHEKRQHRLPFSPRGRSLSRRLMPQPKATRQRGVKATLACAVAPTRAFAGGLSRNGNARPR